MVVAEAVGLGCVLGVLEVILHLTFRLCSLMHELNEVGVGLEVSDLLDGMIESIQESCHCLLIILRDIGSNHGNLQYSSTLFVPCLRSCSFLKRSRL